MARQSKAKGGRTTPKKTEAKETVVLSRRTDKQRSEDAARNHVDVIDSAVEADSKVINFEGQDYRLADDYENVAQAMTVLQVFQDEEDSIENQRAMIKLLVHREDYADFTALVRSKVMEIVEIDRDWQPGDDEPMTIIDMYTLIVRELIAGFKAGIDSDPKESGS